MASRKLLNPSGTKPKILSMAKETTPMANNVSTKVNALCLVLFKKGRKPM
jgi:hypothetical protein